MYCSYCRAMITESNRVIRNGGHKGCQSCEMEFRAAVSHLRKSSAKSPGLTLWRVRAGYATPDGARGVARE